MLLRSLSAIALLAFLLTLCGTPVFAEDSAAPARAQGGMPAMEGEAVESSDILIPFKVRDVVVIVICFAGIVAAALIGASLSQFPAVFFAAGLGFLLMDPVAELMIYHVLKQEGVAANWKYAGASIASYLFGIAFIVIGLLRFRNHPRQMP